MHAVPAPPDAGSAAADNNCREIIDELDKGGSNALPDCHCCAACTYGSDPGRAAALHKAPTRIATFHSFKTKVFRSAATSIKRSEHYNMELHNPEGRTDFGPAEPDSRGQQKIILKLAMRDPNQALQLALNFQAPKETRAQTLVMVAEWAADRYQSVAKEALIEAQKFFPAGLDPRFLDEDLQNSAEIYFRLGDQDSAMNMIAAGLKLAEEQSAKDSDKSDPNDAPRGQWPSTGIYRQFFGLVAKKISLPLALKMIDEISDPDLRPYLQVGLASSLLGVDPEVRGTIRYSSVNGIREIW